MDIKKPRKKSTKSLKTDVKDSLQILKKDHGDFRESVIQIKEIVHRIEIHSGSMAEVLGGFREDNKKHLELLKESYNNNTTHLQIIAGKKQVPISIFGIVVTLLCALLVASEVRYSGVDIELSTRGIKIHHTNNK